MARWEPTHNIIRNFAFGDKQYKKGTQAYLSGECLDFAALNRCATMINPTTPLDTEVIDVSGEGGDVT